MAVCTRCEIGIWELGADRWIKVRRFYAASHAPIFASAAFSADASTIAIAGSFVDSSASKNSTPHHNVRLFPSTGGSKKSVVQHETALEQFQCELRDLHLARISRILASPTSSVIFSTGKDGTIVKTTLDDDWSVEKSRVHLIMLRDKSPICSISLLVGEHTEIVGITSTGAVGIWNYATCELLKEIPPTQISFKRIVPFRQDDRVLMFALHRTENTTSNGTEEKQAKRCSLFRASADDTQLLISREYSAVVDGLEQEPLCLDTTRWYIAVGTTLGKVIIFNMRTSQLVAILVDHKTASTPTQNLSATALSFHRDLPLMATGASDGSVCVYYQPGS